MLLLPSLVRIFNSIRSPNGIVPLDQLENVESRAALIVLTIQSNSDFILFGAAAAATMLQKGVVVVACYGGKVKLWIRGIMHVKMGLRGRLNL